MSRIKREGEKKNNNKVASAAFDTYILRTLRYVHALFRDCSYFLRIYTWL